MEINNLKEHSQIREEMKNIENCITDYMKTFYATAAAAALIVWYLVRSIIESKGIVEGFPNGDTSHIDDVMLQPQTVGYIALVLSIVLVSFSHIIFHKLNSRNRYTGYLRALAYEQWDVSSIAKVNLKKYPDLFLWEICLHFLYNNLAKDFVLQLDPNERRDLATKFYGEIDERFKTKGVAWYINLGRFLYRSCVGIWMIVRTTVRRYDTRSWTFPYVILFGLSGLGSMLIAMWFLIVFDHGILPLAPQIPVMIFVLFGWLGMCLRLYRLCAEDGDRTIDAYMYRFLVCREAVLFSYGIKFEWRHLPVAPEMVLKPGILRLRFT